MKRSMVGPHKSMRWFSGYLPIAAVLGFLLFGISRMAMGGTHDVALYTTWGKLFSLFALVLNIATLFAYVRVLRSMAQQQAFTLRELATPLLSWTLATAAIFLMTACGNFLNVELPGLLQTAAWNLLPSIWFNIAAYAVLAFTYQLITALRKA